MAGSLGQIVFVVWRESLEALLVIGILNAWLGHRSAGEAQSAGRWFLWGGVAAGAVAAGLLGAVLLFFAGLLDGDRADYFQIAMVAVAAALILQMVLWMRKHGGGLRQSLEQGAERAIGRGNLLGVATLCAIAVAREGSETVVFLYGIVAASGRPAGVAEVLAIASGAAAAGLSYGLVQAGARWISWPVFFRVTEVVLLMLAASLMMTLLDRLISLDLLSPLSAPLWDTSWLLDDSRGVGGLIADLTGYRARPELLPVLAYVAYWLAVGRWRLPRRLAKAEPAP